MGLFRLKSPAWVGASAPPRRRYCGGSRVLAASVLLVLLAASSRATAEDGIGTSGSLRTVVPGCRIRLNDDVQLSCERTGILDVVVAEGAEVKAGSVVAKLRDAEIRAQLAVATKEASNDVEVRFAQKATELAQLKYLRALDANKNSPGAVPELELRELRLMADKSLLQLEQAKHQFELAALRRDEIAQRMESYYIRAPFDAFVAQVHKQPGEVVREGEPVLELANTGIVRVEGYVAPENAQAIRAGTPVTVALGSVSGQESARLPGRIAYVGVKVEPVTQKIRFWATVENRDNLLKDGLLADVIIGP